MKKLTMTNKDTFFSDLRLNERFTYSNSIDFLMVIMMADENGVAVDLDSDGHRVATVVEDWSPDLKGKLGILYGYCQAKMGYKLRISYELLNGIGRPSDLDVMDMAASDQISAERQVQKTQDYMVLSDEAKLVIETVISTPPRIFNLFFERHTRTRPIESIRKGMVVEFLRSRGMKWNVVDSTMRELKLFVNNF